MTDVLMPQLGETVREGKLLVWHKRVGDKVEAGELLFDVSTDKVDTEIPAPASGVLSAIEVAAGETVPVGTKLGVIGGAGVAAATSPTPAPPHKGGGAIAKASRPVPSPLVGEGRVGGTLRRAGRWDNKRITPLARRLLSLRNVSIADIAAVTPSEKIGRREVEAFLARRPSTPTYTAGPDTELIPLTRIRRATAEHLASAALIPQVTQGVEVDFSAVDRARKSAGLTFLPFIARAVTIALGEFPHLNAAFVGDSLAVHKRRHLGIAVDLDHQGLVVPVIRDAERFTARGLAAEIARLAERARAGQLSADDMAGGTYTISNNGSFGTLFTTPVINPPQVAILSCDGIARRATVVGEDAIAIRPMGILTQSFDHRALDGAYGGAYLRRLKDILEHRDWLAELA